MTDKLKQKASNYEGIASLLPESTVRAYAHANKFTANLEKGNPAAALSKGKKASVQKKQQREWAIETFMANPYWDYDKTAEHVYKIATKQGHKMVNGNPYELSTIKRAIQGARDEASKRSSEASK